ncbi:hypothetical protein [Streptomyces sp. NPDC002537]
MKRRGIVTVLALAGLGAGAASVAAQDGGDRPKPGPTVESHQSIQLSGNSSGGVAQSLTTHSQGHSHTMEMHCSSDHGRSDSHMVSKSWSDDNGVVLMQASCASG